MISNLSNNSLLAEHMENQNRMINKLTSLLNMRLRVENLTQIPLINKLTQTMESYERERHSLEITLTKYSLLEDRLADYQEKAKDSDLTLNAFNQLKLSYDVKFSDQERSLRESQAINAAITNQLNMQQKLLNEKQNEIEKLIGLKDDIECENVLQKAQINKVDSEKEYYIKQNNNFVMLLKQVQNEKGAEQQNREQKYDLQQQNINQVQYQIEVLQDQLTRCQTEHILQLQRKEEEIEHLQRRCRHLQQQEEMGRDMGQLQDSLKILESKNKIASPVKEKNKQTLKQSSNSAVKSKSGHHLHKRSISLSATHHHKNKV